MAKMTSAQAAKELKRLNELHTALLEKEQKACVFTVAIQEDIEQARPEYCYGNIQTDLRIIEEKIISLKHSINQFNLTYMIEGFDMTIDQMLVYIPQLTAPTSSLDPHEADSVIKIIKQLSKNNTIIVVDHNDKLRKIANRSYFLGPKSGINGGYLIDESEYKESQKKSKIERPALTGREIKVQLFSDYIKYGDPLIIAENALNGICGRSGIGKTTILRDVLPYQLEDYKYITQKPIKAGRNSTVASFSDLLDLVKAFYVRKTHADKKLFSLKQDGACPKCQGKGCVLIGNYYDEQLYIDCEYCDGTGYSRKTLSYKVDGMNIYDFLEQNIDTIIQSGISVSKKFDSTIRLLASLGLGHLVLNQQTNTLSGGENQRLKLSKALGESSTKIFGLDEPSKGLGRNEMISLVQVIYDNIERQGKTFIVSEHNPEFLALCSCVSELVSYNNIVRIKNRH